MLWPRGPASLARVSLQICLASSVPYDFVALRNRVPCCPPVPPLFSPSDQLRGVPVPRYPYQAWEIRFGSLSKTAAGERPKCRRLEFASKIGLRTSSHTYQLSYSYPFSVLVCQDAPAW